jgi:hypothetical protein
MTDSVDDTRSPLEIAQAKRAERKAAMKRAEDFAKAADLEAISDLEEQYGDSSVAVIHVPFTPGLVTACAVRCPTPVELKRYRSRITPKDQKHVPDYTTAAEELAETCLVYPEREAFAKVCEARPGLKVQLGVLASDLGVGKAEREGKG